MTDRERLAAIHLAELLDEDPSWTEFVVEVAARAGRPVMETWFALEFGDQRIRQALAEMARRRREDP